MAKSGRSGAGKTGLCVPASLHLHSPGKGANKTPPECVASDLPQAGCDRSVAAASSNARWPGREGARFAARMADDSARLFIATRRAQGIRFDHERTFDLSAAEPLHAVAGAAAADREPGLFVLRRLSDAAQSELLVDVRRHSRPSCWACRSSPASCWRCTTRRMSISPSIPSKASCATSITAGCCATSTPTAPRSSSSPSTSISRAACITAPTRSRARCCGSSASSCSC